jgi:glucose/mannose-6-phosphate isomerase
LGGNAHIGANQMNENAKRFAGYFLVPELNHHLMEGLVYPKTNSKNVLFVFIESNLYDKRIQKRYEIGKQVLDQHKIPVVSYIAQEKNALAQVFEVLLFTSFASYYSALLEGIDPTAIPVVDFFKTQLKK